MATIDSKQKITPFLWYDGKAREAAEFYVSVFKNSKVISHNPMVSVFELEGLRFNALNGGPEFKFNESVSFVVSCDTQEEIDYFWKKLSEGGNESQCGWLKDKYGLSWQIVPAILGTLMNEPSKAERVMKVVMKTKKFNIDELMQA
jgi:predicted 3-demethylubiquinone-9 3-methyltransferase (glyoxalase superfamily)